MNWVESVLTFAFNAASLGGYGWLWYSLGRRAEARTVPPPPPPPQAVCSCGHGYGKHPAQGGHCGGTTLIRRKWNVSDFPYERFEDEAVDCACTAYDGPSPEFVRMMRGES